MRLTFDLDGEETTVDVPPDRTLRDVLRRACDETSVKAGCESGRCGACTVLLDGTAVKSCLVLAGKVDGRSVTTVRGLDDGPGRDVQDALADHAAVQCGYCSPGVVLSAVAALEDGLDPDRESARDALAGNVCRCTGYERIVDAVVDVAAARAEDGGETGEEDLVGDGNAAGNDDDSRNGADDGNVDDDVAVADGEDPDVAE